MSIPLATTKISVLDRSKVQESGEAYADTPIGRMAIKAKHVRAVIGSPGGSEIVQGGEQTVTQYSLNCDPCPITHESVVEDETTGTLYKVVWVERSQALGLHFMQGQLRRVEGLV